MIIGGYFTWISVFGINQTQVQRYLTVPDKQKVVKWVKKANYSRDHLVSSLAGYLGSLATEFFIKKSVAEPITT